jgi:hypothetical protein
MEKEFVTYEQALALKELGFDEECLSFFYDNGKYLSQFGYNQTEDDVRLCIPNYVKAPLKQQVFRFFREKYNQNSFIELVYQDKIKYDYVLYADKDEEQCGNFGDGPFKTYEEAENACIGKLIEIAKQQDNGN